MFVITQPVPSLSTAHKRGWERFPLNLHEGVSDRLGSSQLDPPTSSPPTPTPEGSSLWKGSSGRPLANAGPEVNLEAGGTSPEPKEPACPGGFFRLRAGPARSRKNPPAQAPRHPCRQGHRQGQAQMLRDRPSLTACPDTLVSSRRGPWPDPWSPGGQGTKLIQGQDWQSRVPQTVARGSSKWESRIPSRDPLPQTLPQPLQLGPRRGPSSIYLRAHVAPEPGSRPRAPA